MTGAYSTAAESQECSMKQCDYAENIKINCQGKKGQMHDKERTGMNWYTNSNNF